MLYRTHVLAFLIHVYWKLLESQNCAVFNFQYGERICISSIGSTTYSESLYLSCFSIQGAAGTTWESSNHTYSWGHWIKAGNNLQSEALQDTQVKTHVQNPFFNSWLLKCFPLGSSTVVIFGVIPENFVMLSASQREWLSLWLILHCTCCWREATDGIRDKGMERQRDEPKYQVKQLTDKMLSENDSLDLEFRWICLTLTLLSILNLRN